MHDRLIGLASIFVLGIGAQWIAWRLKLPSILLLLTAGFLAGPILGFLNPDELMGMELIGPIVSLCVSLILFEGGLTLHFKELKGVGSVVRNLVSVGMLITWFSIAALAYWLFDLPKELAFLLGAALVISGPTVVGPLLKHIRPTGAVGPILKWEGIVIDPVGALIATLVFEAVRDHADAMHAFQATLKTLVWGGGIGLGGAAFLVFFTLRHWIPEHLSIPVTVATVLGVATASNTVQEESGLFAVTVMGVALANQDVVSVRSILRFKENLTVLLISMLFILLSARVTRTDLSAMLSLKGTFFVACIVLIVRPVAVYFSTLRSPLTWRERAFLAWVAPRGIVAAAVMPLFALRLQENGGYPGAEQLGNLTFMVIVGTVLVYGLTAAPVARWLGVAQADPQGILMLGAHPMARQMAKPLKDLGLRVLLLDTNWSNITQARLEGLEATYGNIFDEDLLSRLDLGGIGRLLAIVPNDEVNALAALQCGELFGAINTYQLSAKEGNTHSPLSKDLRGRTAFDDDVNYAYLTKRLREGATIKRTKLTEEYTWEDYNAQYDEQPVILFVYSPSGKLVINDSKSELVGDAGDVVIALVDEREEEQAA